MSSALITLLIDSRLVMINAAHAPVTASNQEEKLLIFLADLSLERNNTVASSLLEL